jgi:alpha-glucosidase
VDAGDGHPGWWYLHLFDSSQPDVNWENPEIHEDYAATLRFWFDMGVDGFRIDVAHSLIKATGYPDGPEPDEVWTPGNETGPAWDQPRVHDVWREWRRIADGYDPPRAFVGEAWVRTTEAQAAYTRPDELHTTFNFHSSRRGGPRACGARSTTPSPRTRRWGRRPPGCWRTTTSGARRRATPRSRAPRRRTCRRSAICGRPTPTGCDATSCAAPRGRGRASSRCSRCRARRTSTRARSSASTRCSTCLPRRGRTPCSSAREASRWAATAAGCRSRGAATGPPTASARARRRGCPSPTTGGG